MNELDAFKKVWNKPENYPTFSEEKIVTMLHKNSSSAVRWIFIIGVTELVLAIILNIYFSLETHKEDYELLSKVKQAPLLLNGITVLAYFIACLFVYLTFRAYKKIKTNRNTKELMKSIFYVRKLVNLYILINLSFFAILYAGLFSYSLYQTLLVKTPTFAHYSPYFKGFIIVILTAVITFLFVGLFWYIYQLFYGRFLKKLKKNYNELQKIDSNE